MRGMKKLWLRHAVFGDGPRGEFLDNLAGLVDAGIPVYDALTEMARAFGRERDPRAEMLWDMARRSERGLPIAQALGPWLAPHEAMILEASGRGVELGAALRNAAHLTGRRRAIVGAVTGAMGYPTVLLAVGAAMLWVFATQVIPALSKIIPDGRWTGLGAFYRALSTVVNEHGLLLLGLALAALVAALRSLSRWRPGRARTWLDRRVPPWSLFQVYQGAVLLIAVSIMMRSGIPMRDAVQILWDNDPSPWLRTHLRQILGTLEAGGGVRLAALNHPVFPTDIRISVTLFDRQSDPDAAMERLGRQAGESAEKSAKRIGALCNALVLLLVGALVGGIIPAVMGVVMQFYTEISTHTR